MVAFQMSVGIVDGLEIVNIRINHKKRGTFKRGFFLKQPFQIEHQVIAVAEVRQGILRDLSLLEFKNQILDFNKKM